MKLGRIANRKWKTCLNQRCLQYRSAVEAGSRNFLKLFTPILIGVAFATSFAAPRSSADDAGLDTGWQELTAGLARAQAMLSDPDYFPAPATDRNLAEGHRYLLAHLNRLIELEFRADPRFPEFFRSMDMLRKWTGENPDTMYLKAPIDGEGYYEVTASVAAGAKAPRVVSLSTITSVPGSTGDLAEMASCRNQTLDSVFSYELPLEQEGRFTLLIGPARPPGYEGHFLLSRKRLQCRSTGESSERHAAFLSVREIFSDWTEEAPLEMEITRLDSVGQSRPPLTSAQVAGIMARIGSELPNQVSFWQQLQELALEVNRDVNKDGRRNMPVNSINPPAPPFTAGGVAGAGQLYAAGTFEIAPDKALILKVHAPVEPLYIGFQLNNLWFEGPDQQNYVSSLSGHQLPVASDGARYYIVAHRDPGLRGWVDTTGLDKGTHTLRFIFEGEVPPEQLPTAQAQLVDFADIGAHVPADTVRVTAEQRRLEIAARQSHIKRRWRGH